MNMRFLPLHWKLSLSGRRAFASTQVCVHLWIRCSTKRGCARCSWRIIQRPASLTSQVRLLTIIDCGVIITNLNLLTGKVIDYYLLQGMVPADKDLAVAKTALAYGDKSPEAVAIKVAYAKLARRVRTIRGKLRAEVQFFLIYLFI